MMMKRKPFKDTLYTLKHIPLIFTVLSISFYVLLWLADKDDLLVFVIPMMVTMLLFILLVNIVIDMGKHLWDRHVVKRSKEDKGDFIYLYKPVEVTETSSNFVVFCIFTGLVIIVAGVFIHFGLTKLLLALLAVEIVWSILKVVYDYFRRG
ncbi:hypothetical protein F373_gp226 [Bacillus phage SP-10]|uniref:hypothetical protein n=1 Tax=Bacillus phage SP10 TaxID=941058 RepID=UPI0002198BB6|nr:hypothetical protein F373_gp226 [Bacillus phage SP-10]BAK53038.1 hypothetical protein [Bacillus phage SP-10]